MKKYKDVVDILKEAVGCPRDYFTIESIKTILSFDGKIVGVCPFTESDWLNTGQEI